MHRISYPGFVVVYQFTESLLKTLSRYELLLYFQVAKVNFLETKDFQKSENFEFIDTYTILQLRYGGAQLIETQLAAKKETLSQS